MLLLQPLLAQSNLLYRLHRLPGARAKARSYATPYAGAMFPWVRYASGGTGAARTRARGGRGAALSHIAAAGVPAHSLRAVRTSRTPARARRSPPSLALRRAPTGRPRAPTRSTSRATSPCRCGSTGRPRATWAARGCARSPSPSCRASPTFGRHGWWRTHPGRSWPASTMRPPTRPATPPPRGARATPTPAPACCTSSTW